jgi:altronate dehydratase
MIAERVEAFALQLHPADDVGIARRTIPAGQAMKNGAAPFEARQEIPQGHKIALHRVASGEPVRRYGQTIGFATRDIEAGEHVHSHNLAVKDFGRNYEFGTDLRTPKPVPERDARTFMGFARPGGRVGTRNYVAVISSVNCSASVSNYVRDRFRTPEFARDFPNVDGVIAFTHKSGCNVQPGEPFHTLRRVHVGLARHPNIAGYVMIGLGCEGNQVEFLRKDFNLDQVSIGQPGPAFMTIQQTGGVRKTVERAVEAVRKILPAANAQTRTPQPISKIVLAENCGGSDGYSGITANPALGIASDELVRHGGTSVLAETPEIYGAEHLLTRRAVSREVGEKLLGLLTWWEEHARIHGATIDNNPSWGNKQGGLTTIYEKSLGAVAKGGQSPLVAVYKYAEEIKAQGFCFMDTPGFDPVSMTGLVAGGCTVGVFTTGRGSVYGCKPSPCIKVATNTPMYEHLADDMDVNAGTFVDGTETLESVGRRIFEKIIAVAGGEKTKSELVGIGDEEFAPWILGPTF